MWLLKYAMKGIKDEVDSNGKATPLLWKGMKEMIETIEIFENMLVENMRTMKI